MNRKAIAERNTSETNIRVSIDLDGSGKQKIDTGVKFFDHMLSGFARHGLFDLEVSCQGDLEIDCHHTIEDIGIVMGEAIAKALGEKTGIARYGHFLLPMDEALILCAVDLGGRPYLRCGFPQSCLRRYGYTDGPGILLCRQLFRTDEYSHQRAVRF